MQRFSNITGQARHGLEKTGLVSRPSPVDGGSAAQQQSPSAGGVGGGGGAGEAAGINGSSGIPSQTPPVHQHPPPPPFPPPPPHQLTPSMHASLQAQAHQHHQLPHIQHVGGVQTTQPRAVNGHSQHQHQQPSTLDDGLVNLSFNVPFASTLAGPDPAEMLHASPKAVERWTFPEGTEEETPIHKLPVHQSNVEQLRRLCRVISEGSQGQIEATVTSAQPKPLPDLQRRPLMGLVTNVCLSGEADMVQKTKTKILTETPIVLKCATVDIDTHLVIRQDMNGVRSEVLDHIDVVAQYTGADIFLLNPKPQDTEAASTSYGNGSAMQFDQRLRVCIYGDPESTEHAKTRIMIMIDQILQRHVDIMRLELSLHSIICGRTRKNVRQIEAATNAAIYFPPPFPRIYGYLPTGARRRGEDEMYITGETKQNVESAKRKLHELVANTKCYVKDVLVSAAKIDCILLDRLDKVRQIMDTHGSYVLFPQLGSQRGLIRVQGTEIVHVEKTVREIMALAGQFYSASWWLDPALSGGNMRAPKPADIRVMLSDICTNSGAEIGFERFTFSITGSDDSVKAAMMVIHQIPFVKRAQSQLRVKIELANEHKEFVSGKKNGKINKIMGQSNVQIIFDGFNEYNFYIDVCGAQYEATKHGLELVEQEMPASISFHVPDQYHKRIIGIGGQHIQRIMKRYSVFVKFSNAMDRGSAGKHIEEDVKVDNVVCRTPARNAQSLDLVKQDIMDMVEKVDAEFVSETVVINRLYHRQLIARMSELHELERKWKCRIAFPSTESASDVVTISGPEYQVPQAVDQFLGMVPESHEIVFPAGPALREFVKSAEFETEVQQKLKLQYEVNLQVHGPEARLEDLKLGDDAEDKTAGKSKDKSTPKKTVDNANSTTIEYRMLLEYTRNNAGGLKDAIDFLIAGLMPYGLDAATVKGAIPRPKSDSFEDSLPFFDSKLLHNGGATPTMGATDSPTRASFGTTASSSISLNSLGKSSMTSPVEAATDDRLSLFGKIRKPGSISSISSFILDRRSRNQNQAQTAQSNGHSPTATRPPSGRSSSIFSKPALHSSSNYPYSFSYSSSNASRASLVSMESRESGYRNPWNDSGISVNLPEGEELSASAFTKFPNNSGSTGGGWNGSKSAFFGTGKTANRSSGSLVSLSSMNAPPPGSATAASFTSAAAGPLNINHHNHANGALSSHPGPASGSLKSPTGLSTPPGLGMFPAGDMTPRHMQAGGNNNNNSNNSNNGDYRASMASSHASSNMSLDSMGHVMSNGAGTGRPGTSHSIGSMHSGLSFGMTGSGGNGGSMHHAPSSGMHHNSSFNNHHMNAAASPFPNGMSTALQSHPTHLPNTSGGTTDPGVIGQPPPSSLSSGK